MSLIWASVVPRRNTAMERLYKFAEVESVIRPSCVPKLIFFVGFLAGCVISFLIVTIITYTIEDNAVVRKINPFELLDNGSSVYVTWDSLDFSAITNDDKNNTVCFDYDDTIAFTTPSFEFAKNISVGSDNQMWDIVNNEHVGERLSVNKNTTSRILHKLLEYAPNLPIRVITSRCSPTPERVAPDEANIQRQIAKIIPEATNLRVYLSCAKFPERMSKLKAIEYFGCRVMFGDSDDDMRSCKLAGNCTPLRILRAPNSTYLADNNPGLFHEPIIIHSEW